MVLPKILMALFIVTQKKGRFFRLKNEKISKRSYAYKHLFCQISNSFHPKLQLKDAKSAFKNELINLLSKLKGFKLFTR